MISDSFLQRTGEISGASVRSDRDTKLTVVNTNSHPNRQTKLASATKTDADWASRLDASDSSTDADSCKPVISRKCT